MKKYDRQLKQWVSEEVYTGNLAKRKKCKNNKEHDYVLVLPQHVKYNSKYKFNPEIYYEKMEEVYKFDKKIKEFLLENGIENGGNYRLSYKTFMCSVCNKYKYE